MNGEMESDKRMSAKWRTVRVFISSTFRDMHAERDWLVQRVFPELRERLQEYRVQLYDIDLRWGVIQAEEAENDQVLDVCLKHIEKCRPFFIGILGERYGYVPEKYPADVLSEYGWIKSHTGKSVTELEIAFGALNDDTMHLHSFFFFRDPAFVAGMPKEIRCVLEENPTNQELHEFSEEQAQQRAEVRRQKLKDLKERICLAKLPSPPMQNYPCRYAGWRINWNLVHAQRKPADREKLRDVEIGGIVRPDEYASLEPQLQQIVRQYGVLHLTGLEEFGNEVRDRLWEGIKSELDLPDTAPTLAETDPLAEESDDHERFMESRLRVYVGRENINRALTEFANSDKTVPCVVAGPSGCGKSAALARFLTTYRDAHRHIMVIPHFIGASRTSTSLGQMLRQFCLILQNEFGFDGEVPRETNQLVSTFRDFLNRAPKDRRILLVIDALNQLDKTDNAHALHWLPWRLPPHIKVVTSCIQDAGREEAVLQAFEQREKHVLTIERLTDDERREIVRKVPSLSAKSLDPKQVELLLDNPATTNPLFLLVALEELRGFGSFEQLTARIRDFPSQGDTVTALFIQVFERLENLFGEELARTILTMLASARRGLLESELQKLVASLADKDGFYPALRQLRPYLFARGWYLDFYHRGLVKAVRARYLDSEQKQRQAHDHLAEFFDQVPHVMTAALTHRQQLWREVDELPWQLAQAQRWSDLYRLLSGIDFFDFACKHNFPDLRFYWSQIQQHSNLRAIDAYQRVLDNPDGHWSNHIKPLASLLFDLGHPHEAFSLRNHLVGYYRRLGHDKGLAEVLLTQASSLRSFGQLDEALAALDEAESILREGLAKHGNAYGAKQGLQTCLCERAAILTVFGQLDEAYGLLEQQLAICNELNDRRGLATAYCSQANVLHRQGHHKEALNRCGTAERINQELGDEKELGITLGTQANIRFTRGEYDEAMKLCHREREICNRIGDRDGMRSNLGLLGQIFHALGEYERAIECQLEGEAVCRELGDRISEQLFLADRAMALEKQHQFVEAIAVLKRREALLHDLRLEHLMPGCWQHKFQILIQQKDVEGAYQVLDELARHYRDRNDKTNLAAILGQQTDLRFQTGDLEAALTICSEHTAICRELGDEGRVERLLGNQVWTLMKLGWLETALPLIDERQELASQLGRGDSLAMCFHCRALISTANGNTADALEWYQREVPMLRKLGDEAGLQDTLFRQAQIYVQQQDLHAASPLVIEAAEICTRLDAKDALLKCCDLWAQIAWSAYSACGDCEQAIHLYEKLEAVSRKHCQEQLLLECLMNRAVILYTTDRLAEAAKVHDEIERICRETDHREGLQMSLGNQGLIQRRLGNLDRAMELYKLQQQICEELRLIDGLARSLTNQAVLLADNFGQPNAALPLVEQACRLLDQHGLERQAEEHARPARQQIQSLLSRQPPHLPH